MSERTADEERLRFEGDLDRWMKAIGAGTSGYQPEAYAMMDAACAELVKLRAAIDTLREPLATFDKPYEFLSDDKAWRLALAVVDAARALVMLEERQGERAADQALVPPEHTMSISDVDRVARALHISCSRQDIHGYLDAKINCTVLAEAALAELSSPTPSEIGWRQRQGGSE